MKKLMMALLVLVLCLSCCASIAEESAATENVFDTSESQAQVESLGIPTVEKVEALRSAADELYEAEKYVEAIAAYEVYAKNANWLANLIAAGLEPYYSASYDNRKEWSPTIVDFRALANAEGIANGYKKGRNEAMLRQGLCYYKLGDHEASVPLLTKALDLVEIKHEEMWLEGYTALFDIIGLVLE